MNAMNWIKKHVLSAVVILALIAGVGLLAGNMNAAAQGTTTPIVSAPVAVQPASAQSSGMFDGTQPFGQQPAGSVVGPLSFSPSNAFVPSSKSVLIHVTLDDKTATTVSFAVNDSIVDADKSSATDVNGAPLTLAIASGTMTLTSQNGMPIGHVALVTFVSKADGLVFARDTGTATLTGPAFRLSSYWDTVKGVWVQTRYCENLMVSDPTASTSNLTVLDNTKADGNPLSWNGAVLKASDPSSNVITVTNPTGLGLGSFVSMCLTRATDGVPYGVPAYKAPAVITVP